ncbi:DUF262 domain-containing protein [Arthrobacter agilis]|nr:DUF262 domain-containing protein [Arthrobacter agilis]WDF33736.1 DUF262 domain-containing protein [Arthrobacter agilis]
MNAVTTGKVRVPKFQRSYVWRPSDVIKLLDSIYRGFPIGILLLWQTDVPGGKSSIGPLEFEVEPNSQGMYLVDGLQRTTSLVGALISHPDVRDERFSIFFDVEKERFVGPSQGVRPHKSVPLTEVLNSRTLLSWVRRFGDEFNENELDTIDEMAGSVRDYKIPVYIVPQHAEQTLREVFDRVNGAGQPISRADIFHALFAHDADAGSPKAVASSLARKGFGAISENRIVQTLLGLRGGDISRDFHSEFRKGESIEDWFVKTETALEMAIEFLIQQGVPHLRLMPSTLPLPVLATFFYLHPEPEPWTKRMLSQWLWRSWTNGLGTGSGGQTPALRRAINIINPVQKQDIHPPESFRAVQQLLEMIPETQLTSLRVDRFSAGTASTRLALLALAHRRPLGPTGQQLDLRELFEKHGSDLIGQIFRSVPRTDLANRILWLPEWGDVLAIDDEIFRHSHLIPSIDMSTKFIEPEEVLARRRDEIYSAMRRFVIHKTDPEAVARRPLSALLVADPPAETE